MAGCWEIHQAMLPGGSGVGSPHSAFQRCLLVRFADTFRWGFLFQWRQSTSRQVYEENLRWRCPCLQTREFSRPSWALRGSRFPYVSIWHWLVVWNMSFFFHKKWDNPFHWLSYFSRWLKPPTRTSWVVPLSSPTESTLCAGALLVDPCWPLPCTVIS